MHSDQRRTSRIDNATPRFLLVVTLVVAAITGCSSDPNPPGAGAPDTGSPGIDAGSTGDANDAGSTADANDAAPTSDGAGDGGGSGHVAVQILAFNDFHGNLEPPAGSGALVTVPIDDPVVGSVGADGGVSTNADAGTAQLPAGGAAEYARGERRGRHRGFAFHLQSVSRRARHPRHE